MPGMRPNDELSSLRLAAQGRLNPKIKRMGKIHNRAVRGDASGTKKSVTKLYVKVYESVLVLDAIFPLLRQLQAETEVRADLKLVTEQLQAQKLFKQLGASRIAEELIAAFEQADASGLDFEE